MAQKSPVRPIKQKPVTESIQTKKDKVVLFDKANGIPILVSVLIATLLFYLQVRNYPHPEMYSDSGSYLTSAVRKVLGYRPIGYSWIISFFHSISSNLHFLPVAQFILHLFASLFLTQTILHFVPVKNIALKYVFHIMVIASPWAIQMTNAVMSDSSFLSLTYIWFASLLWISYSKSGRTQILFLIVNMLALYLAYMVRYIAMIYPVLSCILFFMTLPKWRSIFLTLGLLIVIVIANKKNDSILKSALGPNAPKSAFAGWLLGNNASPIVGHSETNILKTNDKDIRFVQAVMMQYPDSLFSTVNSLNTGFIWDNSLAGKKVVSEIMKRDNISYFQSWFKSGFMVGKWAKWLIFQKPIEFIRYFLWPNGLLVFKLFPIYEPPLFKLEDDVQKWYSYPINQYTHLSNYNTHILSPIAQILGLIQWVGLIVALFFMIKNKNYQLKMIRDVIIVFSLLFILLYFSFHTLASPLNNYRYHVIAYSSVWTIIILVFDVQIPKFSNKNPHASS